MAVSIASEPELQKKMCLRPLGVSSATALAKSKAPGLTAHEWRHVVERVKLVADRLSDFRAAVAGRAREEPGAAVQDFLTVLIPVVHAARAHEEARLTLEPAIIGEWQPIIFERLRGQFH